MFVTASGTFPWQQQKNCKAAANGTHVFTMVPEVHSLCKLGIDSLGTPGFQTTANECLEARMLLGTRRYQVGTDGGNSTVDASRNPTLPGRPEVAERLHAQKMLKNATFPEATIGRAWTSTP